HRLDRVQAARGTLEKAAAVAQRYPGVGLRRPLQQRFGEAAPELAALLQAFEHFGSGRLGEGAERSFATLLGRPRARASRGSAAFERLATRRRLGLGAARVLEASFGASFEGSAFGAPVLFPQAVDDGACDLGLERARQSTANRAEERTAGSRLELTALGGDSSVVLTGFG